MDEFSRMTKLAIEFQAHQHAYATARHRYEMAVLSNHKIESERIRSELHAILDNVLDAQALILMESNRLMGNGFDT